MYQASKKTKTKYDPIVWAKEMESRGAGELLLTSVDREGTWTGLDIQSIENIVNAVTIPVIAHGGVGRSEDIENLLISSDVSAVAIGSLVVFQKKDMGVLVNIPQVKILDREH